MKIFGSTFVIVFFILAFAFGPGTQRHPASQNSSLADHNYRRSFISLDTNLPYRGLTHSPGKDSLYVRALTGTLLQKAHELALDWKETDPKIYYTFLLASLTVPMHESTLMHFTKRSPVEFCYFSNDLIVRYEESIDDLKNLPDSRNVRVQLRNADYLSSNIPRFLEALAMGEDIFKSCPDLQHRETVQQILFSNDYADVGIMMLNSTSHGDFFASGRIFNTDEVLDYGLNYLYDGFEKISINYSQYNCLNPDEGDLSFHKNLIRGAWAGKYNSGNTSRTCRFTDLDHRFSRNDRGFERNLEKIFNGESVYHDYLPLDSIERNFFNDLVANFYQPERLTTVLDQILQTDYQSLQEVIVNNTPDEQSEELIIEEIVFEEETEATEIETTEFEVTEAESEQPEETIVEESLEEISAEIVEESLEEITDEIVEEALEEINDEIIEEIREEPIPVPPEPLPVSENISTYVLWIGNLSGVGVNIRKTPEIIEGNICINSSAISFELIDFVVNGISGDFYEIQNPLELTDCDQSSLYIHKDYVSINYVSTDREDVEEEFKRVRLSTWVTKRDQHGLAHSTVLGVLGPQELIITNEYVYLNRYLWYSTIDTEGNEVWFYAGELGSLIAEEVE